MGTTSFLWRTVVLRAGKEGVLGIYLALLEDPYCMEYMASKVTDLASFYTGTPG